MLGLLWNNVARVGVPVDNKKHYKGEK